MVGGYAANLHGYSRFTGDMDIWLEDFPANRQNLRAALWNYYFTKTAFINQSYKKFLKEGNNKGDSEVIDTSYSLFTKRMIQYF